MMEGARRLYGIPDFRYYALADGIANLLGAVRRPFTARANPGHQDPQMSLFAP